MAGGTGPLGDLRIGDITTFLAVRRNGSISAAARELKVTPSQVTKAIARIESQLQLTLLTRTSKGVSPSEAALQIVPELEEVIDRLGLVARHVKAQERELTLAGPSYLCTAFLPRIAERHPWLRLRGMVMAPATVRACAAEGVFDMAFTIGEERFPPAWAVDLVAEVKKGLYARPELAARLGPAPVPPERLRDVAFISPINSVNGRWVPDDDDCPLAKEERRLGHEVQTFVLGLELAARVDQLVFGPAIAAHPYVARRELIEVPVRGWSVRAPLCIVYNPERVLSRARKAVLETARAALAELETPAPAV